MRILVTGGAGFLGSHLCERLVADGHRVTVLDSFDAFYDPAIKEANLAPLGRRIHLVRGDIREPHDIERAFAGSRPEAVVHLAARAGVRPSLAEPLLYHEVNNLGTLRLLEAARKGEVQRFVFASSSSVYGESDGRPLSESDACDRPLSPYGATKRAGEQHLAVYHRLHGLSAAALRFFTAYGPRQRPDMAIHKFARLIARGEEVPVFGPGDTAKDYTYVADIVEGIVAAVERPMELETVNLGGGRPVRILDLAEGIARRLGRPLRVRRMPLQPGDAMWSLADLSKARSLLGYAPRTTIEEGLDRFVGWFKGTGS